MAKYNVDPNESLSKAITKAFKEISDLTVPLTLMTREWFKGNRSIFDPARKSAGKYEDLTQPYKSRKEAAIGSAYPILRGFLKKKGQPARKSGKLAKSMTEPQNKDSINKIINKKSLILGTKVKSKKGVNYAFLLHHGTSKMKARPLVLFGSEQVAPGAINKRVQNWTDMLSDFVIEKSKGFAS